MKKLRITFRNLLTYFPSVELPVQLTDETHHIFSKENKILPNDFLCQFFPVEEEQLDEFTEYLPCFRIDQLGEYIGLVLWKASLMEYAYTLYTFDQKEMLVAHQIIAGSRSDGKTLLTRQSKIDPDGIISVVEGVGDSSGQGYDPALSRSFSFEILQTGDILRQTDPLDN